MKIKKIILFLVFTSILYSCADYKIRDKNRTSKKYYSSSGFALIYNENLFDQKVIFLRKMFFHLKTEQTPLLTYFSLLI